MSTCNQITLNSLNSCQILSSSYHFIGGHFTEPRAVVQLVSFLASPSLSCALATIHHDWVNPVRWKVPAIQTVRHCASLVYLCTCQLPGIQLVRKGAKRTFMKWMQAMCPVCQQTQCGLCLGPGRMILLVKRFTVCPPPPPKEELIYVNACCCKPRANHNLVQTLTDPTCHM